LKEGRMMTNAERKAKKEEELREQEEKIWDIWEDDTIVP